MNVSEAHLQHSSIQTNVVKAHLQYSRIQVNVTGAHLQPVNDYLVNKYL